MRPYPLSDATLPVLRGKRFDIRALIQNRPLAMCLWFGLSLLLALIHINEGSINNYIIFRNVFHHTLAETNLYADYPSQMGDLNHYGPFFSLVIAPFAWMPDGAGVLCWVAANAAFLLFAVQRLHLDSRSKTFLIFLCANELMINSGQLQANALTCACILLAFTAVQEGRERAALFYICLGGFIKIYAFGGLLFFLFSRDRIAFIRWGFIWSIAFFVAPMLVSSPDFIVQSYFDWAQSIQEKAAQNTTLSIYSIDQNISVMGMVSRIFDPRMNTHGIWLAGIVVFLSQLVHFRHFSDVRYRYYVLCSLLLFTVLFSNGSEACTYIIGVMGMCLWYLLQPQSKRLRVFFFTILVLTTLIYSDLLGGSWMRNTLVKPYSLKAFCPTLLWLLIAVQIHTRQFLKVPVPQSLALRKVTLPGGWPLLWRGRRLLER
jgi:hypothetical protein